MQHLNSNVTFVPI